jgi:hypothetical protein
MSDANSADSRDVSETRADALATVLGPFGNFYYSRLPLSFGGKADVLAFFQHLSGATYVTADLTGMPGDCFAEYELMICHRAPSDWGPDAISRLAQYTMRTHIFAGETMDIEDEGLKDSPIKALIFDTYAKFALYGRECELRLCLGITKEELKFKMEQGSAKLLDRLKRHGVYPYTDFERESVPLDMI